MIPGRHAREGLDVSPAIEVEGLPNSAKSIALICDDPDAPVGTWVHWVLFNWPAGQRSVPEALPAKKELPNGARQGLNDFRSVGYGGPCPPSGIHRYYFKVYVLDAMLDLPAGADKARLLDAMAGHVLAETSLMGRYKKS